MIGVFGPETNSIGAPKFRWTNRNRVKKTRERSFAELRKNRDARPKSYVAAKPKGNAPVIKPKKRG